MTVKRSAPADRIVNDLIVKQGIGYAAAIRRCEDAIAKIERQAAEASEPYREVLAELRRWYADHPEAAHV